MRSTPIKMIFTDEEKIRSILQQIANENKAKFFDMIALDLAGGAYNIENHIFDKLPKYINSKEHITAIAELCYKKAVKSIKALECLISAFIISPDKVKKCLHMTLTDFKYKLKNNDTDFVTEYQFFVFGFLYSFGIGNVYNPKLAVKCFDKAENIIEAQIFKLFVKAKLLENKFSKEEADQFKLQFDLFGKKLKKVKPLEYKGYLAELWENLKDYIYDGDFPDDLDIKYQNMYVKGRDKLSLGRLFSAYYAHIGK